ncbi:MAG TPA: hypothetical protein DCY13_17200 [Verrucomicrobiales bacterium]|nr:hypothetical protein [Verrucomicrobiales bacterium]
MVLLLLQVLLGGLPFLVFGALLTGWIHVAARISTAGMWNLEGTMVLPTLLVLVVTGCHRLFRWLWAHRADAAAPPWRLRSTLAVLGIVGAATVVGMSMVGAAHQTGWLIGNRNSIVTIGPLPAIVDARNVDGAFEQAILVREERGLAGIGGTPLHQFFRPEHSERLRQRYRFYGLMSPEEKPMGVVLVQTASRTGRESQAHALVEGKLESFPVSELPKWTARQSGRLVNLVL